MVLGMVMALVLVSALDIGICNGSTIKSMGNINIGIATGMGTGIGIVVVLDFRIGCEVVDF